MPQGNIKCDPTGYGDEFQLQFRHYKACLQLFLLRPAQEGGEFGDLVGFIAQVCSCYPNFTAGFAAEVMDLLDKHHAVLDGALRQVR
jgi:protein SDA1